MSARWLYVVFALVFVTACDGTGKLRSSREQRPQRDPSSYWPEPMRRDAGTSSNAAPQASCDPGLMRCGTGDSAECVDPESNENCGGCSRVCIASTECLQRRCVSRCTGGQTRCGQTCLDVNSDMRNCGACGTVCFPDQVCTEGRCGCGKDKAPCAGVCVEALIGACGTCGNECPKDAPCQDGASHAADWSTFGADMRRTGYNQGERGTPPLTPEWAVSLLSDPLNPVVVSGKRVYVDGQTRFRGKGPLFALDIATGATLWTYDFGDVSGLSDLTLANCRIYLQNGAGRTPPSRVWSLSADTGEPIWSRILPTQGERFGAPTVDAERVYVNAGTNGGLFAFARSNGSELYRSPTMDRIERAVAAQQGADLYTFMAGKLRSHALNTGAILDTIGVKWNSLGLTPMVGPVLSDTGVAYLVAPPTLYAFELSSKKLLWSHASNVSGFPALAEGRLLAFDSQLLSAFDPATGAVQWRNSEAEGLLQAPVVAAGYAYASSKNATYAFDLRDGSVVWKVNFGGWLSVGGGRLFIAGADGILHSYRLTQPGTTLPDAGVPDASLPDASLPDASAPDASAPDASVADAGMPDSSTP